MKFLFLKLLLKFLFQNCCFDNYAFLSVFLLGWLIFCVFSFIIIISTLFVLFYVLSTVIKISFDYLVLNIIDNSKAFLWLLYFNN